MVFNMHMGYPNASENGNSAELYRHAAEKPSHVALPLLGGGDNFFASYRECSVQWNFIRSSDNVPLIWSISSRPGMEVLDSVHGANFQHAIDADIDQLRNLAQPARILIGALPRRITLGKGVS